MKKFLCFSLAVLMLFCGFMVGCKPSASAKASIVYSAEDMLVIKVESASENAVLTTALDSLKIDYTMSGTMIQSVFGIENKADWSKVWMIYTDDADFSNTAWGSVEYGGKTYGSAILGATELILTSGCCYILYYCGF